MNRLIAAIEIVSIFQVLIATVTAQWNDHYDEEDGK